MKTDTGACQRNEVIRVFLSGRMSDLFAFTVQTTVDWLRP